MRSTTKNQQKNRKATKQASRRLKPAPEKLKEILDLVDMIPTDAELKDVFQVWDELNEQALAELGEWFDTKERELEQGKVTIRYPAEPVGRLNYLIVRSDNVMALSYEVQQKADAVTQGIDSRAVEAVNQCLYGLPKPFQDYVWATGEPVDMETAITQAIGRYTYVREAREKLRLISRIANSEDPIEAFFLTPQLKTNAQIMIDDRGEFFIASDMFAHAIVGVEARRIRECAVCHRIFWAGRIDQPSCSTACAHVLRNRRYRARYKDYLVRKHLKEIGTTATDAQPAKAGKGNKRKDS